MKIWPYFCLFLLLNSTFADRPNFVLILADDLGYADLGIYGNRINSTPALDLMAQEGLRFTDFHSNAPNCSPTRAAILTGLYQQRLGIEGAFGESAKGLSQDTVTLAEKLKEVGYTTGMMGKWHLGYEPENGPTRHGFDEFVGHLHGATDYISHVDRYGRMDWWHNEKAINEKGHNTTLITKYSVRFIEEHQEKPFFLFVSHSAIHFPWQTHDSPAHRKVGKRYEGSKGKLGPHAEGPVQPVVQGMIEELDESVGEILDTLDKHNLSRNTLVIFTSDNGAEGSGAQDPSTFATQRTVASLGYNTDYATLGLKGSYNTINPGFTSAAVSPLSFYKFYVGEGGLRVPLVISGLPLGEVIEQLDRSDATGVAGKLEVGQARGDRAGFPRHGRFLRGSCGCRGRRSRGRGGGCCLRDRRRRRGGSLRFFRRTALLVQLLRRRSIVLHIGPLPEPERGDAENDNNPSLAIHQRTASVKRTPPAGGTGSHPQPPQGWQRQILFTPSHPPRKAPCVSTASRK